MAARQARLIALLGCAALLLGGVRPHATAGAAQARGTTPAKPAAVRRIVSLVPALTEMLFVIGAGPRVVGVSNFDTYPPAVQKLPRVGALLDPDTERILALHPDLVITYGSQDDARTRFERAGIRVFAYRHGGIREVLATMRELGVATGNAAEAAAAAQQMEARIEALRAKVRGRPRPRTALVFDRTPQTLRGLFVSGGVGFMNDMLDAAGAANAFGDIKRESVQPSQEQLLMRAPDVIIEVRARGLLNPADTAADAATWKALASVPAVKSGRVLFLAGEPLVVPGPRLVEGIDMLARAIHPDAFR